MRIVIQRVTSAAVEIDDETIAEINHGMLILVGVGQGDGEKEAEWLAQKTAGLRIFEDENGKMNHSILETGGSALLVSQFTLLADCQKGRRPAFTGAAEPTIAKQIHEKYVEAMMGQGIAIQTGVFAADMKVSLINDGPVTIVIDRTPDQAAS